CRVTRFRPCYGPLSGREGRKSAGPAQRKPPGVGGRTVGDPAGSQKLAEGIATWTGQVHTGEVPAQRAGRHADPFSEAANGEAGLLAKQAELAAELLTCGNAGRVGHSPPPQGTALLPGSARRIQDDPAARRR